jgi:hypothetical protein
MRATLLYGAEDVRVETVPDAEIVEPTDAVISGGRRHPFVSIGKEFLRRQAEPCRVLGRGGVFLRGGPRGMSRRHCGQAGAISGGRPFVGC